MEEKEKQPQEFKAKSIPELVMAAAEEYTTEGLKQIQEPLLEYIGGVMKAAFFSGAYWFAHNDFTEQVLEPVEEKEA